MSETPEQFYERVSGSIRKPDIEEWDTFPLDGDIRPRTLERPSSEDVSRAVRAASTVKDAQRPMRGSSGPTPIGAFVPPPSQVAFRLCSF